MAAINLTDLTNAKLDVDHIDRVATSAAPTSTDRLGHTVPTLSALIAEFPQAAANAATAVANAASAFDQAQAAFVYAGNALSARDQTLALTRMRTTTAAALADVTIADGSYFSTPSTVSGEAAIVYLKSGGVATPVTTVASGALVKGNVLTNGEKVGLYNTIYAGSDLNGATPIVSGGNRVGFTIPSGSTGRSTAVIVLLRPSPQEVALLDGAVIRLKMVATVTPGFLAAHALSGLAAQVLRGTTFSNVGTVERYEEIGTILYRDVTYTVTAADLAFGPGLQVSSGAASSGTTHSITVTSVTYEIVSLAASSTLTPQDLAAALRIAAAVQAADDNLAESIGEQIVTGAARPEATAANGATLTIGGAGYPVGWAGASGTTARTSSLVAMMVPTPEEIAALNGSIVRMSMVLDATAGLLSALTLGGLLAQVNRGAGNVNVGTLRRREQIGTKIYVDVDYTVTGTDLYFGPGLQVAGTSAAIGFNYSLALASCTWKVLTWATATAESRDSRMLTLRLAREAAARNASLRRSLGQQYHWTTTSAQALNGAALITTDKRAMGLSVPGASTGATSFVQARFFPSAGVIAALVGATVRFAFLFAVSSGFKAAKSPSTGFMKAYRTPSDDLAVTVGTTKRDEQIGTRLYRESEYTITAADVAFGVLLQIPSGATAVGTDHTAELIGLDWWVVAWPSTRGSSDTTRTNEIMEAQEPRTKIRTVAAAGGDYTDPASAYAAIADASLARRYQLNVAPGVYGAGDFFTSDYVDMVGAARDRTIVSMRMPAATDLTTIATTETVWHEGNTTLSGLTVEAENSRYAVHNDSNGRKPNRTTRIHDARLIHYGNAGARAYQTSIGQNPNAVWDNTFALGMGIMSGCTFELKNTELIGETGPFSYHTQQAFEKPSAVRVLNSRLWGSGLNGAAPYIGMQPLGSKQVDTCEISDCSSNSDILYAAGVSWYWETLEYQPANHAEISLYGSGNSPMVFRISDTGRALKIESAAGAGTSTVAVSGTAADVLFGEVFTKAGAGDGVSFLKGYAYGFNDVSGNNVGKNNDVSITSMGKRLGDCSTVAKTMQVTVNGGAPITVTFNANHTAQSNATILGIINAALGAAATASLYAIGERYRPFFADEERRLLNATTRAIPMGSVLAWDGSRNQVRLMTSADPASLRAGVAWEDIYPGTAGRVKTKGWLALVDVLRTDGAALAFGDGLSIDAAAPGKVKKDATAPVLVAIRPDAVEVAPK